jgi:chaperonin cofactor prefoldin
MNRMNWFNISTIMRVLNMTKEEVEALSEDAQMYMFYGAYFIERLEEGAGLNDAIREKSRSGRKQVKRNK